MAGEDADEFALGLLELVVEAAKDALGGEGLVVLDEVGGEILGGEGILVKNFCKPTATISEELGLNQFDSLQWGVNDLHSHSLSATRDFYGLVTQDTHFGAGSWTKMKLFVFLSSSASRLERSGSCN